MAGLRPDPVGAQRLANVARSGGARGAGGLLPSSPRSTDVTTRTPGRVVDPGETLLGRGIGRHNHFSGVIKAAGVAPAATYSLDHVPDQQPNWPHVHVNGLVRYFGQWTITDNVLDVSGLGLTSSDVLWVAYHWTTAAPEQTLVLRPGPLQQRGSAPLGTIVGGGSQLADDSDATYAQFSSGSFPYLRAVFQTNALAGATVTGIEVAVRLSGTGNAHTASPFFTNDQNQTQPSDAINYLIDIPLAAGAATTVVTHDVVDSNAPGSVVPSGTRWDFVSFPAACAEGFEVVLTTGFPGTAPFSTRYYEVAITVTYTT